MAKRHQVLGQCHGALQSYHTQSSSFSPELHRGPRPLVRIANGLTKCSQQKQTTRDYFNLAAKLDSVLMCLCICDKKLKYQKLLLRFVKQSHKIKKRNLKLIKLTIVQFLWIVHLNSCSLKCGAKILKSLRMVFQANLKFNLHHQPFFATQFNTILLNTKYKH